MGEVIRPLFLFIKNIPKGWGDAWCHYFYYQGRTNNAGFWSFAIFNSLMAFIFFIISYYLGLVYRIQIFTIYVDAYLLFTLYILLSLIPSFCLCIRRLHDLNFRGWWFWLWLPCLFISLPYIYINFMCQWLLLIVATYPSGEKNRFGDKPHETFSV